MNFFVFFMFIYICCKCRWSCYGHLAIPNMVASFMSALLQVNILRHIVFLSFCISHFLWNYLITSFIMVLHNKVLNELSVLFLFIYIFCKWRWRCCGHFTTFNIVNIHWCPISSDFHLSSSYTCFHHGIVLSLKGKQNGTCVIPSFCCKS